MDIKHNNGCICCLVRPVRRHLFTYIVYIPVLVLRRINVVCVSSY